MGSVATSHTGFRFTPWRVSSSLSTGRAHNKEAGHGRWCFEASSLLGAGLRRYVLQFHRGASNGGYALTGCLGAWR